MVRKVREKLLALRPVICSKSAMDSGLLPWMIRNNSRFSQLALQRVLAQFQPPKHALAAQLVQLEDDFTAVLTAQRAHQCDEGLRSGFECLAHAAVGPLRCDPRRFAAGEFSAGRLADRHRWI